MNNIGVRAILKTSLFILSLFTFFVPTDSPLHYPLPTALPHVLIYLLLLRLILLSLLYLISLLLFSSSSCFFYVTMPVNIRPARARECNV